MTSQFKPVPRTYDPLKAGSIDGTDTTPHDMAIVRAINSTYTPNDSCVGNPTKTLFVGRLSPATDEDTLKDAFRKFGKIKHCRVVKDPVTLESRRYGFVIFAHQDDCSYAQKRGNKMTIDDKTVLVDFENSRNMPGWVPRRLGGGLGGMKGSGQLRFGGRDRPFKPPIVIDKVDNNNNNNNNNTTRRIIVSDFDNKQSESKFRDQKQDEKSADHRHESRHHHHRSDNHNESRHRRSQHRSESRHHKSTRFDRDYLYRDSRSTSVDSKHSQKKKKKKKKKKHKSGESD